MTRGARALARDGTETVRVLCAGDSNTYGLRLAPHQAYPAQLEAVWRERGLRPALEAHNLGFPGTNSSRLVRDLPELLDRLAPDVLLLMVGVNDYWTRGLPSDEADVSGWRRLLERSRVRRLYWLLRSRVVAPPEVARDPRAIPAGASQRMEVAGRTFDVGYERADEASAGGAGRLGPNLERLAAAARERGVAVVLMSYPARNGFYPAASQVLRGTALREEVDLVDLEEVFRPLCPEEACPELLFSDGHPTAAGYRVIAEALVDELAARYGR